MSDLIVCESADLPRAAASAMSAAIADAVRERGSARIALSGGSTPLPAYALLAEVLPPAVTLFFVDDRCVPPDHPRSNYGAIPASLLARVRAVRIEGELPPAEAATRYGDRIAHEFGTVDPACVAFDLLVAGIGADGHTASLFPRSGAVRILSAIAIAVDPGGALEPRVTLTKPVIRAARRLIVLAAGADKRAALSLARAPGDEDEIPARILGGATWLVDRSAAP